MLDINFNGDLSNTFKKFFKLFFITKNFTFIFNNSIIDHKINY